MIGTYLLDVETWNLEFSVVMSVRYFPDLKHMSVHLDDHKRPVYRTMYYGPLIGLGGRDGVLGLRAWLSEFEPCGLNENALNHIGNLLAGLWATRLDKSPPNPHRSEVRDKYAREA